MPDVSAGRAPAVFASLLAAAVAVALAAPAAAATLAGEVRDLNGHPVAGAAITVTPGVPGPTSTTVFSDAQGRFAFPAATQVAAGGDLVLRIRALGYDLLDTSAPPANGDRRDIALLLRPTSNQAASAPASAWLATLGAADREATSSFVLDCMGCHQVPMPEVRRYANAIADVPGTDRAHISRESWGALIKYMNYISAEEFGRGQSKPVEAHGAYAVGNGPKDVAYLTRLFPGRADSVGGYAWGAPLVTTPRTTIEEFAIARPNAIREAVLLPDGFLYVADVASNRLFKLDPKTGTSKALEIPHGGPVGPHSLHRAADGTLWIAPFVSSVIAHLDPKTEKFRTWPMKTTDGRPTGIHDLSFGTEHVVLADRRGRVWFSDIGNDAVGWLDPKTGRSESYPVPEIAGRAENGSTYGLAMTADRERIYYSQLGIGHVGAYNIRTGKFDDSIVLPENSGPRRLAIGDGDILYIPLFGSGQLVVHDTRARKTLGTYDLPDRASAPYAVTWDPVRKVVWIPTSNSDVIYRFDPKDGSFGVLPMPRSGAYLRMIDIDPATGRLITSYANIVEQAHGPRMAVVVDPGDGAYDRRKEMRR